MIKYFVSPKKRDEYKQMLYEWGLLWGHIVDVTELHQRRGCVQDAALFTARSMQIPAISTVHVLVCLILTSAERYGPPSLLNEGEHTPTIGSFNQPPHLNSLWTLPHAQKTLWRYFGTTEACEELGMQNMCSKGGKGASCTYIMTPDGSEGLMTA